MSERGAIAGRNLRSKNVCARIAMKKPRVTSAAANGIPIGREQVCQQACLVRSRSRPRKWLADGTQPDPGWNVSS